MLGCILLLQKQYFTSVSWLLNLDTISSYIFFIYTFCNVVQLGNTYRGSITFIKFMEPASLTMLNGWTSWATISASAVTFFYLFIFLRWESKHHLLLMDMHVINAQVSSMCCYSFCSLWNKGTFQNVSIPQKLLSFASKTAHFRYPAYPYQQQQRETQDNWMHHS